MIEIRDQFLILQKDREYTLEIDDLDMYDVPITDPITKKQKMTQRMQLHLTSVDGRKTDVFLSFVSKKAQLILAELETSGVLRTRPIKVKKTGESFFTEYSFTVL